MRRGMMAVAAVLAWTGPGKAADLVVAASGPVVAVAGEPTPLEWLRDVRPREGRDVALVLGAATVRTIEWRHPVEVRVRSESGDPLTDRERAAILDLAQVCDRGEVRDVTTRTERNGTFVVDYACVWLQGFEDQ